MQLLYSFLNINILSESRANQTLAYQGLEFLSGYISLKIDIVSWLL